MTKKEKRDYVLYAEMGMGFYLVSFVLYVWPFLFLPLFFRFEPLSYGEWRVLIVGLIPACVPLIQAYLTYAKIVKVYRENRKPSKRWVEALEILGYFLGFFITGLMLYIADRKFT
jgi:hypothetical protein